MKQNFKTDLTLFRRFQPFLQLLSNAEKIQDFATYGLLKQRKLKIPLQSANSYLKKKCYVTYTTTSDSVGQNFG